MSTRAFVARINRAGTGLYFYLGRNAYPQTPGQTVLESYPGPEQIDAIIAIDHAMDAIRSEIRRTHGQREVGQSHVLMPRRRPGRTDG